MSRPLLGALLAGAMLLAPAVANASSGDPCSCAEKVCDATKACIATGASVFFTMVLHGASGDAAEKAGLAACEAAIILTILGGWWARFLLMFVVLCVVSWINIRVGIPWALNALLIGGLGAGLVRLDRQAREDQ